MNQDASEEQKTMQNTHPEVWAEKHPIPRATSQLHSKDKGQATTRGYGKDTPSNHTAALLMSNFTI